MVFNNVGTDSDDCPRSYYVPLRDETVKYPNIIMALLNSDIRKIRSKFGREVYENPNEYNKYIKEV